MGGGCLVGGVACLGGHLLCVCAGCHCDCLGCCDVGLGYLVGCLGGKGDLNGCALCRVEVNHLRFREVEDGAVVEDRGAGHCDGVGAIVLYVVQVGFHSGFNFLGEQGIWCHGVLVG